MQRPLEVVGRGGAVGSLRLGATQAGGKQGGARQTRRVGVARARGGRSEDGSGGSRLPYQAGQGCKGGPGVGEIGQGFGSRLAVDGQAFQVPAFEGGIAAFRGVACTVVEAFPGGCADGQVSGQADRAVGEALADVDNASMRVVGGLIGTLLRNHARSGHRF